jgi:hypothetical protein
VSDAEPQNSEPDPGRKLMIAALVGIGVLLVGVIIAMGYFAWQAIHRDGEAALGPGFAVRTGDAAWPAFHPLL